MKEFTALSSIADIRAGMGATPWGCESDIQCTEAGEKCVGGQCIQGGGSSFWDWMGEVCPGDDSIGIAGEAAGQSGGV